MPQSIIVTKNFLIIMQEIIYSDVPLYHRKLSRDLNLSNESVSYALSRFEKEGFITRQKETVNNLYNNVYSGHVRLNIYVTEMGVGWFAENCLKLKEFIFVESLNTNVRKIYTPYSEKKMS